MEIRNRIDKIATRSMATKMLKASTDEEKLNILEKRLEQMSHRATYQTLVSMCAALCLILESFTENLETN